MGGMLLIRHLLVIATVLWLAQVLCLTPALATNHLSKIFTKEPDTILLGIKGSEKIVKTKLLCALWATTLGHNGYNLTSTQEGFINCTTYSSIVGSRRVVGSTAYVTDSSRPFLYEYKLHNGNWLLFYPKRLPDLNFDEAVQWCSDHYASMFIPKNSDDWNFLVQEFYRMTYYDIWLPMTDRDSEGNLKWIDGTDGTTSNFLSWYGNETGYDNGSFEDCVCAYKYTKDNLARLISCNYHPNGFVCKHQPN